MTTDDAAALDGVALVAKVVNDVADWLEALAPKMTNKRTVAALSRARCAVDRWGIDGLRRINDVKSKDPVVRMALAWSDAEELAALGKALNGKFRRSQTAYAIALWLIAERDGKKEMARFVEALLSPIRTPECSPLIAFDAWIERTGDRAKTHSRTVSPYEQAGAFLKAYNYWRQGEALRTLSFRAYGESPEQFPWSIKRPAKKGAKAA